MTKPAYSTIDDAEIEQFSRIAESWWDEKGKFRPLHQMNPVRIGYIREHAGTYFGCALDEHPPFKGMTLADIGCGGGLLCEPMTRLGFAVTGVDASEKNIGVAKLHATQSGLDIRYLATTAEDIAGKQEQFDVVLALEIIEHVADVEFFVASLAAIVKPGGLLFISTLNRTLKSLALAKIGAEYVLRMVPRGTHDWRKFLLPSEIETLASSHALQLHDLCGIRYHPLKGVFTLDAHDLDVNYLMAFEKKAACQHQILTET